ncbi:MAG: NAD(P)-binding domain-containing protein [Alphaproteobacteria bacterium]|nr:NAD(P)-binding domain-containing protein [Alphaproteobacteria bacterium]MCB9695270.1 NAD(P)-binding domain-containing protein [Alphaproteobacteria bacterium]
MRVLFADKLPDRARVRLASKGFEVRSEPKLTAAELGDRLREFEPDVLVVRSTKVTADHVAAGKKLSLVVRAGAGVNTIDVKACSGRGIFVTNCPGKNAVAVAELAMGLMLALDRRIPDGVADLRAGRWAKSAYSGGLGLKTRTLGVIGTGDIGRAVIRRAQAFGMKVVAWSRSLTDELAAELGVERAATPESLAARSDVVTVHLALNDQTRGFVGESVFSVMKHGALFLNTSRAEVVDETALLRALDERALRAGLDVFSGEPSGGEAPFDHPLAKHPNVYGSHHIGASTEEAQEAVGDEACRIIEAFRDDGVVLNGVNSLVRSTATHRVTVRHLDRVGVLAGVLGTLREAKINVQEMANVVFPGGAAIARVQVSSAPGADVVERLDALEHVLDVSVVAL